MCIIIYTCIHICIYIYLHIWHTTILPHPPRLQQQEVYIHIYIYIYIYIYTWICLYIYIWRYTFIHTGIYTHTHVCVYECMCVCIYANICYTQNNRRHGAMRILKNHLCTSLCVKFSRARWLMRNYAEGLSELLKRYAEVTANLGRHAAGS